MSLRRFSASVLAAVALCLVALPALGAAATNGTYAGKTGQGFNIHARVAGSHIYLIRVKARLRCHDGGLLYDDLSDFEATPLDRTGNFTDVQFGPSDEVQWRGHLKGSQIRGSVRVKDKVTGGIACDSGTVRFSMSR
jgi:hypothetical protein